MTMGLCQVGDHPPKTKDGCSVGFPLPPHRIPSLRKKQTFSFAHGHSNPVELRPKFDAEISGPVRAQFGPIVNPAKARWSGFGSREWEWIRIEPWRCFSFGKGVPFFAFGRIWSPFKSIPERVP